MKTINLTSKERLAKRIGAVINAVIIVLGGGTMIYGVVIWASHYLKY